MVTAQIKVNGITLFTLTAQKWQRIIKTVEKWFSRSNYSTVEIWYAGVNVPCCTTIEK